MPTARPTMLASASGELNTRSAPYAFCKPWVTLNTPPLPGTCGSADTLLASATSSPKTTIRGFRAISSFSVRLMAATIVSALPSACAGVSNAAEVGSTVGEKTNESAVSIEGFGALSATSVDSAISRSTDAVMASRSASVAIFSASRNARILRQRIALRFRLPLVRRLVQPLIVRERVRVRPNHLGVHERRLPLAAHPCHGFAERAVALEEVGAVAAQQLEVRERLDQPRDVAARGLHFDRDRDRVAVVFHQVQHRHAARARGVERFPELAFARGALADRDVGDLVGMEVILAIGDVR